MDIPKEKMGTIKVILDGQQRLTTLYLVITGDIPPYYKEHEIEHDPRKLYFNLKTGEFQYYIKSKMQGDPFWVSIIKCFNEDINVFKIAVIKVKDDTKKFELSQQLGNNLTKLRNMKQRLYPIQTVPDTAHIDDAIDIFDLVNSQGTKLSEAELALAHICGKWSQARKVIKSKIKELKKYQFSFDLDFFVRCLTGVVRGRALYKTIHSAEREKVEGAWAKINGIIDYLLGILRKNAYIHSTDDLSTRNVLVPIVVYLAKHSGKFESQREVNSFLHWMYLALIWSHYSGQVDQKLDKDISIVINSANPYQELVDEIVDERGRIEVKPSDLEGRGIQHPLYKMMYIVAKSKGAVDWFNGSPLYDNVGKSYSIHNHHIFPTSLLYSKDKGGYDPKNHLHLIIVNEIANRAVLTQKSNLSVSNQEPSIYLKNVKDKYPKALSKQFVPDDEYFWEVERYEDFLVERRRLVANAINKYLDDLLIKESDKVEASIKDIIEKGESETVEFKSTLRWNMEQHRKDKEIEFAVLKTIVGFMNSKGGTLLVGVNNNKKVIGLQNDYDTLWRTNRDGFELHLRSKIDSFIGKEFAHFVKISFEELEGKDICRVEVKDSPKPIFIEKDGGEEFYIRSGNATKPLDKREIAEYIKMHWKE